MTAEQARTQARRIATTAHDRWRSVYGPSRLEVPVSAVACLALYTGVRQPDALDPLRRLPDLRLHEFRRDQWARWNHAAAVWPTLHPYWMCFFEWLAEPDNHLLLAGARAVVAGCLDAGLLGFVGDPHRRTRVDLLGAVLYELRRDSFGGLTDPLTVRPRRDVQRLSTAQPGDTLTLSGVGTGTRLLPVLHDLRGRGVAPVSVRWRFQEIDELAAACLAVNTVLWGLHPSVLIGTSDSDDWLDEAHEVREAALRRDCGH